MPLRITLERILDQLETLENRRREGVDLYDQEFQRLKSLSENLKSLSEYSSSCGEKDVNRRKNRYKDILPFDNTRVTLSEIPGVPGSDYINANYIKGASGSLAYIASQGPLPHTVEDFWRMVWECEVQVIIMASSEVEGGKHKCERYWVYENEERTFGNLKITLIRMKQVCVDFIVRTMNLHCNNEDRTIIQFHYVSWPDHGIPDSVAPILNMVKLVRDCQASETLPILVHCSAGCGRTGTICAIDYVWGLLRTGKLNDDFNLYQLIVDMRKQRIAMVQTKEQYILVHRAVKEMFEHHLEVIDSHPYENIDFSGLPLIDRADSDLSCNEPNLNASFSADQQLQKFLSQLESSEVPPIPEKKKVAGLMKVSESLPSPNDVPVKHLISTWNSGRPLPVSDFESDGKSETSIYSVESKSSESIHKQKLDHCDVGFHREDEGAKARHIEKASMESEHSTVSPDKAVVLRKPSIAKLRAIFEKTSPQEEMPDQEKGHKHENLKEVNRSDSERKKTSGLKRHKSHFRKIKDVPQVTARYKDTALKVYAEIRNSDDQESTESISSSSESKTSSSPVDKGKDSPELDFLYRFGSRRRSIQRNPASVWYDKEAEINQGKIDEPSVQKSPEKPALAVKRSKSLKVHSLTENAFGFFKLPSPLRHRKPTVAAYLAVEEEHASAERNNNTNTVQNENVGLSAITDDNSSEAQNKSELSPSDKINVDISTSDTNKNENPCNSNNLLKDNSKEKLKIKHYFGEKASNTIPNSGNDSVKLVHVKSTLDTETEILYADAEKEVIDISDRQYPIEKSKSIEKIKFESTSDDSLRVDKNFTPGKGVRKEHKQHYHVYCNTVPNIESVKKINYNATPSPHLNQTISSKSADQIEDRPPPLPVKVNSPRNSPRFQRPVRSLENTLDKNDKYQKQWEQKPIKKLAVISVPSVTKELKHDKDESDIPVQLTVSAPSAFSDSLGKSEKSSHSVDDEEGYQQIIRSCQEYLLSSSYTNVFPEMQKNLLFIEHTLHKHPRGGFIDVLSSNESIASNSAVDKNSNAVVDNTVHLNQMQAEIETSLPDEEKSWKASMMQDSHEGGEKNTSEKVNYFLPNAALDELLASCEIYSTENNQQSNDSFQFKIQPHDDTKIPDLPPVSSDNQNANDMKMILVNSDLNNTPDVFNEGKIQKDDKLPKSKENKSKTNYEHLWLSHSGNCSETNDIISNKNQTDDERTNSKIQDENYKIECSLNELLQSPETVVTDEMVSISPPPEPELKHMYVNLQRLELQNLQENSTDLEKNFMKDKSEGQTNKINSPAVARRKKNVVDSKENDPGWNLNSYKILKEILHKQNSVEESQLEGENLSVADQNVNKKTCVEMFDNSHSKSKISQEPPPKPARVHCDNKIRKPQPLPRNILIVKKETPGSSEMNKSTFTMSADNGSRKSQEITNNSCNNIRDEELYAMIVHKDVDNVTRGSQDVSEKLDIKKENDYEEIILPPIVPQQERLLGASRNNKRFKDALFSNESNVRRSSGEFQSSPVDLFYSQADSLLNNTRQYQRSYSYSSAADHVYESLDPIIEPSANMRLREKEILMFKTSPELFLGNLPHNPSSEEVVSEQLDASRNIQCQHFDNVEIAATGLQSEEKEIDPTMYSEVSKCKTNEQDDLNESLYTKDDTELYPIAPPRKRQSSNLTTPEANSDQFWKTRTLPGRRSSCLQDDSSPVQQWGEEWDSDDDCQPPVPAKTKEAYMLPNQRDTTSTGSSQDGSESKNKAFSKFNIFSKLGLKTDNKNSDGVNATAFPNRLPRRPKGPRTPPASWNVGVPTRT